MPATSKVVRHSRHEFVKHDGEADGAIYAGQIIVENGDGTVSAGSDGTSRLLVAKDDRERGMEILDSYSDGDNVIYLAVSGGGVNLLLADGETLDPSAENRLVADENGFLTVFDSDAGDEEADVVAITVEDETIEADGEPEPISVEVA